MHVRYWRAGKDGLLAVSNYGPGLQVLTSGGHSAQAGMPGAGGAGVGAGAGAAARGTAGAEAAGAIGCGAGVAARRLGGSNNRV